MADSRNEPIWNVCCWGYSGLGPGGPTCPRLTQAVWKREAAKIKAAFEATASLVTGASGDEIVHRTDSMWRKMRSGFRAGAETVCLSEHDADGSSVAGIPLGLKGKLK